MCGEGGLVYVRHWMWGQCAHWRVRPQEVHRNELSSQGSNSIRGLAEPMGNTQKPPLTPQGWGAVKVY